MTNTFTETQQAIKNYISRNYKTVGEMRDDLGITPGTAYRFVKGFRAHLITKEVRYGSRGPAAKAYRWKN